MFSTINYEKELNPAQLEAVMATEGPFLVIAGAGSGKTRVLVFRTAHLVEKGVAPERILLLTFTRRASREMIKRATELLDTRCSQVSGGTFHSFANSILRRYSEAVNLPRFFSILDQDDAENAVNLVRTQMRQIDKRFPKKNTLLSIISKSINKGISVNDVVYGEYPQFSEWSHSIEHIKNEYIRYKHSLALLDYDDLLVYLKALLENHKHIREHLSEYYQYIMVDEYQDTNKIQADIVRLLASTHNNVMVVGDDSQSIYSFRGAHFKNIIDFPNIFKGTKVITLEENYRSTQPILDLTNEVINSAEEKFDKSLFTRNGGDTLPVYVDVYNENSQSKYIVRKILDIRRESNIPLSEIAILFRSGWHSNDLEVELASNGIPFVKYGGQKFIEAAHIKDVLSILQVIYNPLSEVAWQRVLMLIKGVGEKTAMQIIEEIVRQRKGLEIDEKIFAKKPELTKLFKILKGLDWTAEKPLDVLRTVLDFYTPLLMQHYDDYDKRLNDLGSLENIAQRYVSLEEFLTDMALEPPEKTLVDKGQRTHGENDLILSTIHSAKGLEWHTVFVIYLAEGFLPSSQSLNSDTGIEEERRLFYVAATRAKNNLYLLRPQIDTSPRRSWDTTGSMYTRVSRFLEEGGILQKFVTVETDRSGYNPFRSWEQKEPKEQKKEFYDDW